MKTRLEILEETIALVKKQGRATIQVTKLNEDGMSYTKDICVYYTPERCCAFGDKMKDKYKTEEFALKNKAYFASQLLDTIGIEILQEEYQIDDPAFWNSIQKLHDNAGNWDADNELTKLGLLEVDWLKYDFYDFCDGEDK